MSNKRNRTPLECIDYGLYLYFLGLSLRNDVKALSYLNIVKRSMFSLPKSGSGFRSFIQKKMSLVERKEVSEYIVDETVLNAGSENIWLWAATEPENGQFLAQIISKEKNMFVAERFLSSIVRDYGKHPVSTDGEGTWYPMACKFLKLKHHIHSLLAKKEKSLIERKIQYIKDRPEGVDDYFPCRQKNCKLKHVRNWLNLFVSCHNGKMINA